MTRLTSWDIRVNARCACALLLVITAGAPEVGGDGYSASQTPAGATTEQVNPEAEWFERSVRPQDDFFQHVNGGWINAAQIPADRPSYGVIQQVRLKVERDLQAIFDDIAGSNAPEGSDDQKLRDFYRSYMDEPAIEAAGLQPLRAELAAIDAIRSLEDFARHLGHLARRRRAGKRALRREGFAGAGGVTASRAAPSQVVPGRGQIEMDIYIKQ